MNNDFDYSKVYYKVTNERENHNGYQYHNGLNILEGEFNDNPKESCVSGRLYFTDYYHLPLFFGYGTWIREVRIPQDATVIEDPEEDKWGTDMIILGNKYHIHDDFDKWFDPNRYNWQDSYYLAGYCSEQFDKWFDPERFNWKNSYYLAEYCSEQFDKWFDPERFNWDYSDFLAKYCPEHFNEWFDPKRLTSNVYEYLNSYCHKQLIDWLSDKKNKKQAKSIINKYL